MFGQRASNDNFTKESDIISGSFIASATNTLTQLNTQLSKLQESSKSIVKSMTDAVSKIKTVDKDMSQRFKKLNAEITASRPDFGKFLYKAPPLPLADIAPGSIQQGKLANTAGLNIPRLPIPDVDLPDRKRIPGGGNARGGGTGGGGRSGTTPRTGGGVISETPNKGASPKPPGAPETKPRASVPEAGSRTGAGAPTQAEPPKTPPPGEPTKTPTMDGKAAGKAALTKAASFLPAGLFGVLAVVEGKAEYDDAKKQYDEDIKNKVDPKIAQDKLNQTISEIFGKALGDLAGGLGGAKLGALVGSAFPGVGTLVGAVAGGVTGSVIGADLGLVAGQAIHDKFKDGNVDFNDAFKNRWDALSKLKQEQWFAGTREVQGEMGKVLGEVGARARRRAGIPPAPVQPAQTDGGSAGAGAGAPSGAPAATTPPPPEATNAPEQKEESGEGGTKVAPSDGDKTNTTGAPAAAAPTPTTPSAPPPAPRPNQGAGGADVIVNKTTNMSSSSSSGDGQNVTNPNMKMNAHNTLISPSLSRQMLQEHN